jgi:hypothetical protein
LHTFDNKNNTLVAVRIDAMDKSALQQRLEARRNMFFNKPDPATATASSALNFAAARIGKKQEGTTFFVECQNVECKIVERQNVEQKKY